MSNGIVEQGLAAFEQACKDRDHYRHQAESFERSFTIAESENKLLRDQIKKIEINAGFHMRHSVELATHLSDIGKIIHDALEKARIGAYRDNVAPRTSKLSESMEAQPDKPIPTFLTTPRDEASLAAIAAELTK